MSRGPLLPSGRRRGLPFVVPADWTPEQAPAVFDLLDGLVATITDFYDVQIHAQRSVDAMFTSMRRWHWLRSVPQP